MTVPRSSRSLESFLGFFGSAAINGLVWDGEGVLDARETRTREEGEVMDPEKELAPPEEEVAAEAAADLLLLLTLAGVSSPPPLCAERPVLIARAVFRRAARDCARQNGKVSVDGERGHYMV